MNNLLTKTQFIILLFESDSPKEACELFNQYPQFIGKISLPECIEYLYNTQLYSDQSWKQLDRFIEPSKHINKLILRDLLDVGYVESCPDEITAEKVFSFTFLMVELGMYCIASEFYASACSFVPGMQEYWDTLKDDKNPNLRSYIDKFRDQELNLDFMKGVLHE